MRPLLAGILWAVALCWAGVIRVPAQQPTIQAGLNAAQSGDTVLVAAGTYPERISWPGVDGIVLLSEQGADATVIDGGRAGRVITMNAITYSPATVVQGFRIANGQQTGSAAGVLCRGAPVFRNNQIVDNLTVQATTGGGVYADGAPVFAFNLIGRDSLKVTNTAGFRYGGGIYCTGSGVFYQNVFLDNAVWDTSCSGFRYGGGLFLAGGMPVVFANLFLGNAARMVDGSGFSYGGGVCVGSGATAYIVNNTFVGNVCAAHITYGGGIYAPFGGTVVKNNIVVQNRCDGSGQGGGIASDSLAMVFDYNDVWQNYPNDYYRCTVGPHALARDPLFVAAPFGNYCLSQVASGQPENSPCLDAGDTLLMTSPLKLDSLVHAWTTRTDSVPDAAAIDIGYHYAPTPLIGIGVGPVLPGLEPNLVIAPNPAAGPRVRIAGRLGQAVAVFDVSGRTVLQQRLAPHHGSVELAIGRLSAGVYVVRTELNGLSAAGRLIVQR